LSTETDCVTAEALNGRPCREELAPRCPRIFALRKAHCRGLIKLKWLGVEQVEVSPGNGRFSNTEKIDGKDYKVFESVMGNAMGGSTKYRYVVDESNSSYRRIAATDTGLNLRMLSGAEVDIGPSMEGFDDLVRQVKERYNNVKGIKPIPPRTSP
jgi:hypothetical protein